MRYLLAVCSLGLATASFAERFTITESLGATDLEIVRVLRVPNSNDFVVGYRDRADLTASYVAKFNKDGLIWKKRCVAAGRNEGNLVDLVVDSAGNVTWLSKAQFDGTQWRSVLQQFVGANGAVRWGKYYFTTLPEGFRVDQLRAGRNGLIYCTVFTNKFEGREVDPSTGVISKSFEFGPNVTEVHDFNSSYPGIVAYVTANGQKSYIKYSPDSQTVIPWITGNSTLEAYFDIEAVKHFMISRGDVNAVHEYRFDFVEEYAKTFSEPLVSRIDMIFTFGYLTSQEIFMRSYLATKAPDITHSISDFFANACQYRLEGKAYRAVDAVSTNNLAHGLATELRFRRYSAFSDPSYHVAPSHHLIRDEIVDNEGHFGKPFIVCSPQARTTIVYPKTVNGINGLEVYSPPRRGPVSVPDSFVVTEDVRLVSQADTIRANDYDPEMLNGISAELVSNLNPELGTVAIQGGGKTFTYVPKKDMYGVATIMYQARCGGLVGPPTPITVTILPVNDAPVARTETYTVDRNAVKDVPVAGVLANDSDAEGSPLTAQLRSPVTGGTLTFRANGSFRYVAPSTAGTYTFTYRARATADGMCSPDSTVTINVN